MVRVTELFPASENAGKLTVYVKCYSGGHTNIIIDITGYIE